MDTSKYQKHTHVRTGPRTLLPVPLDTLLGRTESGSWQ